MGSVGLPERVPRRSEERQRASRDVFFALDVVREEMLRSFDVIRRGRKRRRGSFGRERVRRAGYFIRERVLRRLRGLATESPARISLAGGRFHRSIEVDAKTDRLGGGAAVRPVLFFLLLLLFGEEEEERNERENLADGENHGRRRGAGERVFGVSFGGFGGAGRFERGELLAGRTGDSRIQRKVQIRRRRGAVTEIKHAESWELFRF